VFVAFMTDALAAMTSPNLRAQSALGCFAHSHTDIFVMIVLVMILQHSILILSFAMQTVAQ
jgi:hypothetical protein